MNDQTSTLKRAQSRGTAPPPPASRNPLVNRLLDYSVDDWQFQSLLGLLFVTSDLFIDRELAALDGDEDVGVLCRWGDELCHDKLSVLTSTHAQRLEALQTVLIVNLELLQGKSGVLDKITEECSVLDWLDDLLTLREVLDGDT